jgi:hypothetical protein
MLSMNVGRADQVVRGVVGTVLVLSAGIGVLDGGWKVLAMLVGGIFVFTASAGFCPLYRVFGLTSCRN